MKSICTLLLAVILNINLYASSEVLQSSSVLEVVIFTVNHNTSPAKVRDLAASITPLLHKYPGFISRTFGQNSQNSAQWVDVVRWRSQKDATFAAKNIIKSKSMKHFTAIMHHYDMYHFKLAV